MATNMLDVLPVILLTDEAQFTRDCINNIRNSHSWAHENPQEATERYFQRCVSVNVWGITSMDHMHRGTSHSTLLQALPAK
jgi:hypothetical protein